MNFDHEVRINNLVKHFNIFKKETNEKIKNLQEEIIKLNKEKEDKLYREMMDYNH